ncbi:MAG TPA: ATP synthase F1 subunit delta [Bryobacteraceae bacterium]|nr:ATP synthase F1 subunit delta [Bryobacteraceae bacterium]
MASAIASRYARPLADIVMEPGSSIQPPDAIEQLKTIEALVASSSDLRHALSTPAVRPAHKRAVADRLIADLGISRIIRNFLFVIIDHRRMALLTEIREAFEAEVDERLGFLRAEVASAQPLDDKESAAIENELSRLTGKQIRARFHVDPNLIGGVVARIGSTVYDGSIRGQLDNMRRRLSYQAASAS